MKLNVHKFILFKLTFIILTQWNAKQNTNKEHKDVVKIKKGGASLKIHFYIQIIIHMQKILLLDFCIFPLLQILHIHNNKGNNFYIVLKFMWIIAILVLFTHVQTNMCLNKKTMLCVHIRIHPHYTYTRVDKCFHHLLLFHTTIIKMSLS